MDPSIAEAGDDYGGPELTSVTLACPQLPGKQPDCSRTFAVGLSLVAAGGPPSSSSKPPIRLASILVLQPSASGYALTALVTGLVELNPELVSGGPHFLPIEFGNGSSTFYFPVLPISSPVDARFRLPGWGLEKRTGVPVVDAAIEAALSGDEARLGALVRYFEVGCVTKADGIGAAALCDEGVEVGTPVEVWTSSDCVGHYFRAGDFVDRRVANLSTQPRRLYAAWRRDVSPGYLPAGYDVLFSASTDVGDLDAIAHTLHLDNSGKLIGANFGCGQEPGNRLQFLGPLDFVLPPPP